MSKTADLLIQKLPASGDKKAYDELFKKFYPRLTGYACLFLEAQAAEDIVQDLFVYLWENSGSVKIHTSLEAYLFKAVYLRCLNQLKQRKTRNSHHDFLRDYLSEVQSRLFDPDANESIRKLFMEDLRDEIRSAIDSLPERCREVFMLSYIYKLKNKEISEVLGVSLSTVENHICNALKVLRRKLGK
jgi:RNA polymerase sigma-70 factor (ECF subfamily)